MARRIIPLLLLFCATFGNLPANAQDSLIVGTVRTLGISDSSKVYEKLSLLEKNAPLGIKLLVAELKPMPAVTRIPPEAAEKYPREVHIVWCIRALRYLTGTEFTARTTHKFSNSENVRSQMLHSQNGECSFFGVRMAHDVIYLAPSDAQRSIIKKWQH